MGAHIKNMKLEDKMFGFIKKSLGNKIMAAIVITVMLVMSAEIYLRIYFGAKDRIELMIEGGKELANSTYSGIKYPMSRGDAEAIKKQLSYIRERMKGVEVFICDFNQVVIYSTHQDKIKTKLPHSIQNKAALQTLSESLKTGVEPKEAFEDDIFGRRYLVIFQPILNQKECYHCHGHSRKVLGSLITRMRTETAYATVAAQRNRTLVLAAFGISLIITLIYLMVNKLVRRPVENLAEKARRFAEGDMTVSVDIKTDDEIGILGNTFNYMVESVSSASKKLEQEITRKTTLLNERTQILTLLERANRELRKLEKLKSTFLAKMSHELRTP